MVSRVLGLARDVAMTLIPIPSRDAFIVAFRFPNMLRDILGEGASNAAFVPVLSETQEKEGEEAFKELVASAMFAMIVIFALVTLAGLIGLPYLLRYGLPTLAGIAGEAPKTPENEALLVSLTLWIFPYIFLMGLAIFMMAPLFVLKHYLTPSWTPALFNLSIIFACLLLRNYFAEPAYALVVGVWMGGFAQLAVQYVALGKISGVWKPKLSLSHPGIRKMFWLIVPVLIGQSAGEVNKLVDNLFAASLEDGVVSALFYANRLIQLPLAIFGVATAVAILPTLSKASAREDEDHFRETLIHGLRRAYYLAFPAMVGLILLRRPIVNLLYGWNTNTAQDLEFISTATAYYGVGLIAFVGIKILVSAFYADQNTRTPVIVAFWCMALNVLLNIALVEPLGYRGLAMSTTIAFTLNFLFLFILLSIRFGTIFDKPAINAVFRASLATLVMAAAAYATHYNIAASMDMATFVGRLVDVSASITVAVIVYCALSAALQISEFRDFTDVIRARFRS